MDVLATYRRLPAQPGVPSLMILGLLGKMPIMGISTVLLLHVVDNLGRGFGAGSLVAACWTAGGGLGAPLQGRGRDRYGLRPMFIALMVEQGLFWGLAHLLPFPALLAAAFVGGLSGLPAFTVVRLAVAQMVDAENRHTAYAAEAITTDLAYMSGPSLGILLATTVSPRAAFLAMGALLTSTAIAYLLLNPPLRPASPPSSRPGPAAG